MSTNYLKNQEEQELEKILYYAKTSGNDFLMFKVKLEKQLNFLKEVDVEAIKEEFWSLYQNKVLIPVLDSYLKTAKQNLEFLEKEIQNCDFKNLIVLANKVLIEKEKKEQNNLNKKVKELFERGAQVVVRFETVDSHYFTTSNVFEDDEMTFEPFINRLKNDLNITLPLQKEVKDKMDQIKRDNASAKQMYDNFKTLSYGEIFFIPEYKTIEKAMHNKTEEQQER